MTTPRELRVALPHITLAALEWGDPEAPPLVALHGWLDNAGSFALLAPLLAQRHRVIALELPGHGHSGHLPAGASYHYLDYVRAVLAALDALELPRCALLGHSLGAGIAALLAAAAPARIGRLQLIEGLGPLGDDGAHTLRRYRDALAAPPANGKALRVFRDAGQAARARSLASGLDARLAHPIVERGLRETEGGWQWRSDPRLVRSTAIRLAEAQIHALLAGIEAPTALLLAQPATPYLPTAMMAARAACVPRIAVEHMDGGHHLQLEHPQAVAQWMLHRPDPLRTGSRDTRTGACPSPGRE
jgi:pimeloyl-ACP methyl ester carboxylesterase